MQEHGNKAEPFIASDLNVRGKRCTNALMCACRLRCVEIVNLLVNAGANLNLKDGANGWTALSEACMRMGGKAVDLVVSPTCIIG